MTAQELIEEVTLDHHSTLIRENGRWYLSLPEVFEDTLFMKVSSHPSVIFLRGSKRHHRYIKLVPNTSEERARLNLNPVLGEFPLQRPIERQKDGSFRVVLPSVIPDRLNLSSSQHSGKRFQTEYCSSGTDLNETIGLTDVVVIHTDKPCE